MLNARNEVNVGYDVIATAYAKAFPGAQADAVNFAYFTVLYGIAASLDPDVVVEIGTQYGISTRAFLMATPQVDRIRKSDQTIAWRGPKRVVHSIDIDPEAGETTGDAVDAIGCTDRWQFHLGRSQDIEPIECDLLYVDGDHSYAAVCSDMARHGVRVRDGGLVILDDYHWSWPGKVRWVDERRKVLDPWIIGPTAVVRVTPEKRASFTQEFE